MSIKKKSRNCVTFFYTKWYNYFVKVAVQLSVVDGVP